MMIKSSSDNIKAGMVRAKPARGFVLLEIVIALGLFAAVAVSLVKALHMTSQTAAMIQDGMRIDRVLRSVISTS